MPPYSSLLPFSNNSFSVIEFRMGTSLKESDGNGKFLMMQWFNGAGSE
jgi:hypothetical protein